MLDQRWIDLHQRLLQARGGRCQSCDSVEKLTIHHGYYRFNADPWDYPDETLWLLCWPCHEKTQLLNIQMHRAIAKVHPKSLHGLVPAVADATHEVTFGISKSEADTILQEERALQATLYGEYVAEITACSEYGPSMAYEIEAAALKLFPGLQIFVSVRDHSPDSVTSVTGPDATVVARVQAFFDRARDKTA